MDEREVRELLRDVEDPDLRSDIVSLGLVNTIEVDEGTARISLALGAPYSVNETRIADQVADALDEVGVEAELTAHVERDTAELDVVPEVRNVIAVASGKGGVGKSTVSVNLAVGLADVGAKVGLFDADVYGPNVPTMLGATESPSVAGEESVAPPERYGVKVMSLDFLVGEEDPVIWRGPMVHEMLTRLFETVEWGSLDYLVIDLPPGTGDTHLTMVQTLPITGAVIVTTPQSVSLDDAHKSVELFGEHDIPVLGIVENMSTYQCPDCGSNHDIFGSGGGRAFAEEVRLPLLGSIPLDPRVRNGDEHGRPIVLDDQRPTGDAIRSVADTVANMVGVVRRRRHSQRVQSTQ